MKNRPRRGVIQLRTSIDLRPCTSRAAQGCFSESACVGSGMGIRLVNEHWDPLRPAQVMTFGSFAGSCGRLLCFRNFQR